MINLLQKTTAASVLFMLCLFMSGVSDRTYARDHAVEIPENARATNYGKGWECKQGYRLNKGD
jgi:hypothetical protein